jgi:hypothetical protein
MGGSVRRQGIAIFSACAGYGVIVGPVSFLLLLEPALRIPAVQPPKRSPPGSAYLPHNTQRCGQPSSVVLARLDRPEADF